MIVTATISFRACVGAGVESHATLVISFSPPQKSVGISPLIKPQDPTQAIAHSR